MSGISQLVDELQTKHHEMGELLFALSAVSSAEQAVTKVPDEGPTEPVVHRGVELGSEVHLDEDVYDQVHTPPRIYVFEAYDSEAPVDSNCTLVDRASGDWTVRGISELVPVDDRADDGDELEVE
jgi:hypothetical protein